MSNYCPTCGNALQYAEAEICPNCGVRIKAPPAPHEVRNPWLAVLFSFLFYGWGQWYNGKTWDGLKFFGAFLGLYFLMFVFSFMAAFEPSAAAFIILVFLALIGLWVYGMYEAKNTADRINRNEESFSGKSGLFWLPIVLIVGMVVLIVLAAVIAAFVFGMSG
jgi:ABC-type phosphate/phosphonate transport system permease subunit